MKRFSMYIFLLMLITGISCGNSGKQEAGTMVLINTDFGEIKLKLYDDTPEHKKNFIKLIEEGFYNDLLFHRVIKNFMIQGGDPTSRNAKQNIMLGGGSPGYTVPAEINSKYFHKKGALAAARQGGPSNPEKRSSGSQFYIVQGEIYTEGALDTMEMKINFQLKDKLLKEHYNANTEQLLEFRKNNDREGFDFKVAEIREKVDSIFETQEKFKIPEQRRKIYTTIGGYPSLDGEYTVFGEVVEGFEVIDKIAEVETNNHNRPLTNVSMQIKILK